MLLRARLVPQVPGEVRELLPWRAAQFREFILANF